MPEKNRLLVFRDMGSLTLIKILSYFFFVGALILAVLGLGNGDEHSGSFMALLFLGVLATLVHTVLKALHIRVSDLEGRMSSGLLEPSDSRDRHDEQIREQDFGEAAEQRRASQN
jgi:hypothetical protein